MIFVVAVRSVASIYARTPVCTADTDLGKYIARSVYFDHANTQFYPGVYVAVITLLTYPVSTCTSSSKYDDGREIELILTEFAPMKARRVALLLENRLMALLFCLFSYLFIEISREKQKQEMAFSRPCTSVDFKFSEGAWGNISCKVCFINT